MSSVVKGIKKAFKKVGKFLKKALPIVLAVGALVFTGGAALGLTSVAWGGAGGIASTIGSAIGGSGVVGSALTGAITQAGYGALAGGVISKASGGSFSQGAKAGAITGAITGGVSHAYGHLKNAAQGIQGPGVQANGVKTTAMPDAGAPTGQYLDAAGNPISTEQAVAAGTNVPGVPGTPPPPTGLSQKLAGAFKEGGWVERNQDLVGNVVKGVGGALVAGGEADAEKDLLRERQRLTAANYAGTDPGANYRPAQPGSGGLMPSQRFSANYYGSFEYRYNPETARIERVPVGG